MKLERILITDCETSGLDPDRDVLLEVAGVLVDVDHAEVIRACSTLFAATKNDAESVNQIPVKLLAKIDGYGKHAQPFLDLVNEADILVAHRASFDRSFLRKYFSDKRIAGETVPFVCSKFGVDWPQGRYGQHLTDLALAHGVPVTSNHRALDDCLLLARVMKRVQGTRDDENPLPALYDGERYTSLEALLRAGLDRGVGEPNRCRHPWVYEGPATRDAPAGGPDRRVWVTGSFKDQCAKYVRSYRPEVIFCSAHGGPSEWVA